MLCGSKAEAHSDRRGRQDQAPQRSGGENTAIWINFRGCNLDVIAIHFWKGKEETFPEIFMDQKLSVMTQLA